MMDELGLSADIVGASSIFTGDEEVFAFARALVSFPLSSPERIVLTTVFSSIVQSRLAEMSSVQWTSAPHTATKADGLDNTSKAQDRAVRLKGEGRKVKGVEEVREKVKEVSGRP